MLPETLLRLLMGRPGSHFGVLVVALLSVAHACVKERDNGHDGAWVKVEFGRSSQVTALFAPATVGSNLVVVAMLGPFSSVTQVKTVQKSCSCQEITFHVSGKPVSMPYRLSANDVLTLHTRLHIQRPGQFVEAVRLLIEQSGSEMIRTLLIRGTATPEFVVQPTMLTIPSASQPPGAELIVRIERADGRRFVLDRVELPPPFSQAHPEATNTRDSRSWSLRLQLQPPNALAAMSPSDHFLRLISGKDIIDIPVRVINQDPIAVVPGAVVAHLPARTSREYAVTISTSTDKGTVEWSSAEIAEKSCSIDGLEVHATSVSPSKVRVAIRLTAGAMGGRLHAIIKCRLRTNSGDMVRTIGISGLASK